MSLPVIYRKSLLLQHSSLYLLISYFQSVPPPFPLPIVNYKFVIFFCKSVSVLHICSFELFLDSTYKWYHTVFVFVWLISLSVTFSRHIHVAAHGNISFYGWIIFHCVLCVCVRERHLFKSQLSVCGHLDYFHVLTTVHSAAMNIGMLISFWIRALLGFWIIW